MFKIHFNIEKSISIQKSASEVREYLTDFTKSSLWSPWLCLDDSGKTEIKNIPSQIGHAQLWDGPIIGSGIQTLKSLSEDSIEIELEFLRPFKSISQTSFKIAEYQSSTEVTWKMKNSLPFFLFFLKKFMIFMLGGDLARGLTRLKELCEMGKVLSTLGPVTAMNVDSFYFQGIEGHCTINEIPTIMPISFEKLMVILQKENDNQNPLKHSGFISLYHNLDPMKDRVHFTAGIFHNEKMKQLENLHSGKIDNHRALKLLSQGPYHHLKSAWSKVFSYQRSNKIKENKTIPIYEIMLNKPAEIELEKLLTEIRLPIK